MTKYGNRLIEIGKAVGPVTQQLFVLDHEIDMTEASIAFWKNSIVPEGGWPGKNEAERKVAQETAYANHSAIQAAQASLSALRRSKAELRGIEALYESERRSLEFAVRDRLASVLLGYDDDMDVVQNKEQIDPLIPLTEPAKISPSPVNPNPARQTSTASPSPDQPKQTRTTDAGVFEIPDFGSPKIIVTDGQEIKVPDWSTPTAPTAPVVVDDIFGSTTGKPTTLVEGAKKESGLYRPPTVKLEPNPREQEILKDLSND